MLSSAILIAISTLLTLSNCAPTPPQERTTQIAWLSLTSWHGETIYTNVSLPVLSAMLPSATSCANAPFPSECRTAEQAWAPIILGFHAYNITQLGEQAAILAWMIFESAGFVYNQNHFPAPGNPGQGLRNMQSPAFNAKYAASIPQVAAMVGGMSPAQVLAVLQDDYPSFASGSWFVSSQCQKSVRDGLAMVTEAGFEAFMTGCVQTTMTEERKAGWQTVVKAMGLQSQGSVPVQ